MKTKYIKRYFYYIILAIGAFIMLIPFLWVFSNSLKTPENVLRIPPQYIPNPLTLENFKIVLKELSFMRYMANSFFVVIMNLIGTVFSSALIGFGFAMFDFKGKKLLFTLMLATLMMPSQVTMIPTYFIWSKAGFLDTYAPLIIPGFLGQATGIFLFHQNYKSMPNVLYESALIDGCNPLGILFRIYFPLSKPTVMTLVILTFIGAWNNTMGPLLYLQTREKYTLTMGLLTLNSSPIAGANMGVRMAGAVITMAPVILVFLFAQKYFVQGNISSGVKG
ncbi:carbohydrate ABC transporter permease [Anaerocolumna aminovalerica]|jgi:multiple sugar transport system permease protein|uniref:Carbohydrate ABC transporter membrane protein 2, CUT1 family n=1 Tax=Anaerocolumna aminovalerica TaxID=1527 RepID=A0A1I5DZ02_9FIRM|nr:carbohydrate ABC transporter permease [Anaerocolumna aminovalerica]MDU6263449.1 carbohydrate ABC transporter permease [Anaerocolumna aminovalerica]SFO04387.1 carbohydrate ABC transporter membrane protein 2, CUT1 family [Anaerocolumna aminovalerica]